MASSQGKRPIRRTQPAPRVQTTEPNPQFDLPRRKVLNFREVKGKLVEEVLFSSEPGCESISVNFEDKTCLEFVIKTGFTLKTSLSDWNFLEQRILREWPPIKSLKA